jgi:hypothetical protein
MRREESDIARQTGGTVISREHLHQQDAAFRQAVLAAIERGEETCATAVSTVAGTRHPIAGYRRE